MYGVLRCKYPELFRGSLALEHVIDPCRFWEPTLVGKTKAVAVDRGDEVWESAMAKRRVHAAGAPDSG